MDTGRPDFNALVRVRSIPIDEPTLIVRAQDVAGPDTARAYAAIAFEMGASPALVEMALRRGDAMAAWPKKKIPDVDLSEAEAANLTYALSRRAWRTREAFPSESIVLAHRCGVDEGLAQARSEIRALQAQIEALKTQIAEVAS